MSDASVNWLLVGTGDIARKRVAAALREAPDSRLTAVCDRDPTRATEAAREHGVTEVYDNFDTALRDADANAVYIATPVALHTSQTTAALQAGKHVLVEKPLGLTGAQAREAAAVADRAGLVAGCAYFRRCTPRYAMAEEMLEHGAFGQVVLVRLAYYSWFQPEPEHPKHWRVVREKGGGGPLADMGTHMFDILIGLFGMPRTVFARTDTLVNDWDVEDAAAVVMALGNGALVTASFHWNSKTWSHEFEIVGTEARVKWHPCDGAGVVKTVGREVQELDMPNAANVHLPLVTDFVEAVSQGRAPRIPLGEAAKTNVLLDAVYASARAGKEVSL